MGISTTWPRDGTSVRVGISGPVSADGSRSTEEWSARRRLVQFWRKQEGTKITAAFGPIPQSEYSSHQNSIIISCIFREDNNCCYVTSVDAIYLLEALVGNRFTVEEKNRIRRNLEGFRPITVSKTKQGSEEFFKLIMGFPNPKPRNIEKDVKALRKIIGKYVSGNEVVCTRADESVCDVRWTQHHSHPAAARLRASACPRVPDHGGYHSCTTPASTRPVRTARHHSEPHAPFKLRFEHLLRIIDHLPVHPTHLAPARHTSSAHVELGLALAFPLGVAYISDLPAHVAIRQACERVRQHVADAYQLVLVRPGDILGDIDRRRPDSRISTDKRRVRADRRTPQLHRSSAPATARASNHLAGAELQRSARAVPGSRAVAKSGPACRSVRPGISFGLSRLYSESFIYNHSPSIIIYPVSVTLARDFFVTLWTIGRSKVDKRRTSVVPAV
jgi:hypothetical protein